MNGRTLRCKRYHDVLRREDEGQQRTVGDRKSRCPGWLVDTTLRQRLLDDALVDPEAGQDSLGRPKRVWNAINGWFLVGVSTNEQESAYNCYPEEPSVLLPELEQRAERTIDDVLGRGGGV
jgi:hypothetical protein